MNHYIISTKTGLQRVSSLLEELNISQYKLDPLFFIKYGYKNLSSQDKETYYLLQGISNLNKTHTCNTHLDYLALVLNTTIAAQANRIRNLQRANLITVQEGETYHIPNPLPDSTLVSTIVKLLRRKKLGTLLNEYKKCNNPRKRMTYLQEIKKLQKKGATHFKSSSLLLEN
jgi:hypothetical protein